MTDLDRLEKWKWVEGYEGLYVISNKGRVAGKHGEIKLKPRNARQPYPSVCLSKANKKKFYNIHTLLMKHFGPPQPKDKPFVTHINDDPTDNRLSNLKWGDVSSNAQDKIRNDRQPNGERVGGSKISNKEAKKIRLLRDLGVSPFLLAEIYGVHYSSIWKIVTGRTFKHVI